MTSSFGCEEVAEPVVSELVEPVEAAEVRSGHGSEIAQRIYH